MTTFSPEAYTVGWFCVLPVELKASRAMLDEEHNPPTTPYDENSYIFGRMGEHNIVIAALVVKGRTSTAEAAVNMIRTFKQIRFGLKVGIAGGAANATDPRGFPNDILLGDVVVSRPDGGHGGILQYDQGTQYPGRYEIKSHLNRPQPMLISATGRLESHHDIGRGKMQEYIDAAITKIPNGPKHFSFPGRESDLLFQTPYHHATDSTKNCCDKCDRTHLVADRESRRTPSVHYGLVASADTVLRDGELRNAMHEKHEALCFEMEAAGLANRFPCLAICGIADYADTHKNGQWRPYAAVVAAAYAKDLLGEISPRAVEESESVIKQLNDTVQKMETVLDAAQRRKILDWLSPLEPPRENRNLVATGQWLLESEEFERWTDGGRWQLRLCGEAGTGKACCPVTMVIEVAKEPILTCVNQTDLCAIVARHLRTSLPSRPVIAIHLSDQPSIRKTQTPDDTLGYMVRQLIQFDPKADLPPKLREAHESHAPRTETFLKEILQELLLKYDRTYLIVDGLNQCSPEVVDIAKIYPMELIRDGLPLSLLTTSLGYRETTSVVFCNVCNRPNISVYFRCTCGGANFDICLKCKDAGGSCPRKHEEEYDTVRVEVRARDEELGRYCQSRLKHIPRSCGDRRDERLHSSPPYESAAVRYLRDKPDLVRRVAQIIASNAQGKFLLAKVWTEKLINLPVEPKNEQQLLDELDYIPFDHLKGYCRGRIETLKLYNDEPALQVALKTLAYVATAFRALPLLAVQHALALTSDSSGFGDLNLHHRTYILRATNGLVTIDKGDVEHSFVRLLHDTLGAVFREDEHEPHLKNPNSAMASLCMVYFRHEQFDIHCESLKSYPFLAYALEHWGDHVRLASFEGDPALQNKAGRLLENTKLVTKLTRASHGVKGLRDFIYEGVSAAHLCAWFGLSDVLCEWKGQNLDILERRRRRSPLRYACLKGYSDTVEQLLKLNVGIEDVTLADTIQGLPQGTRLDEEQKQRIKIVDMLLETGKVNVNAMVDGKKRTALMVAVKNGHYDLVRCLLKKNAIDLDARDADGRTALSYAVYTQPSYSRSRKCWKKANWDGMLDLLLERDASPNTRDDTGRTVLALAVTAGSSTAVKALLNADSLDLKSEKHLLHIASAAGYPDIIRQLYTALCKKTGCAPDINALDENKLTPLHYTSLSRSPRAAKTAKTLLEIGANPNRIDMRGCTPYDTALLTKQTDVISVLSERAIPSSQQRSIIDLPGLALAYNGYWAVLKDCIRAKRPDIAHRDILTGNTLLHVAATANQPDVVSMLLAQSQLHMVSQANHHGQTALHLVHSAEIAKILIQHDCDPKHVDYNGDTAWSLARRTPVKQKVAEYLDSVKPPRVANGDNSTPHVADMQKNKEEDGGLLGAPGRFAAVDTQGVPSRNDAPGAKYFSLRAVLYFHLVACVAIMNLTSAPKRLGLALELKPPAISKIG
ncbi:ankyrin [Aspergillus californicus]